MWINLLLEKNKETNWVWYCSNKYYISRLHWVFFPFLFFSMEFHKNSMKKWLNKMMLMMMMILIVLTMMAEKYTKILYCNEKEKKKKLLEGNCTRIYNKCRFVYTTYRLSGNNNNDAIANFECYLNQFNSG